MILHANRMGQGPTLVVLHGLLGSWENWGNLSAKLSDQFEVIGLDLRNHGASPHATTLSYDNMADDVIETLAHLGIDHCYLLGHSMGGKVAMVLSGRWFNNLQSNTPESVLGDIEKTDSEYLKINKLIVVDIAPRTYQPQHSAILDAMYTLDTQQLVSRGEADKALQGVIAVTAIRQFILKNLVRRESGGYQWRLNLSVLRSHYRSLLTMPAPQLPRFEQPVLLIRGADSDYVTPADESILSQRYPQLSVKAIAGAGHWPHASHPKEVEILIRQFLS